MAHDSGNGLGLTVKAKEFQTVGGREEFSIHRSDAAFQSLRAGCDFRDCPLKSGDRDDQGHQLLRCCSQDHKPVTAHPEGHLPHTPLQCEVGFMVPKYLLKGEKLLS